MDCTRRHSQRRSSTRSRMRDCQDRMTRRRRAKTKRRLAAACRRQSRPTINNQRMQAACVNRLTMLATSGSLGTETSCTPLYTTSGGLLIVAVHEIALTPGCSANHVRKEASHSAHHQRERRQKQQRDSGGDKCSADIPREGNGCRRLRARAVQARSERGRVRAVHNPRQRQRQRGRLHADRHRSDI